jgi:hypothetical protein
MWEKWGDYLLTQFRELLSFVVAVLLIISNPANILGGGGLDEDSDDDGSGALQVDEDGNAILPDYGDRSLGSAKAVIRQYVTSHFCESCYNFQGNSLKLVYRQASTEQEGSCTVG